MLRVMMSLLICGMVLTACVSNECICVLPPRPLRPQLEQTHQETIDPNFLKIVDYSMQLDLWADIVEKEHGKK